MAERKLALRQKPKKAMKALQYGGKLSVLHKPRCVCVRGTRPSPRTRRTGPHCVGDASEIKNLGHPRPAATNYLKRNIFIRDGHRAVKPQINQDACRLIEKFVAVHENDVAALTCV